jgi:hypothetical protein
MASQGSGLYPFNSPFPSGRTACFPGVFEGQSYFCNVADLPKGLKIEIAVVERSIFSGNSRVGLSANG